MGGRRRTHHESTGGGRVARGEKRRWNLEIGIRKMRNIMIFVG
jgi:hypothetical protein